MATIKGIKVGTSTITASYGGKSSSVELTVSALNLNSATISGLSNITYDGSAHKTNPTVTMTVGGESTTLVKDTDYTVGWNSSSDTSTCKAVGTITVTVTGKGNFSGSKTATYQITNATITARTNKTGATTVVDQSYTYSGSAQGVGIVATTVNSQTATIKYRITSSGDYTLTSAPQATNVSDTKTVYYKITAPNHSDLTGSYNLTITAKSISITAPTSVSKTYDGNSYSATFAAVTGASITKYQTSGDGTSWTDANPATTNPSRSTVGTTYVRAYYTAGTNYTGSGYSASATVKITNATITVTASNQSYTYNGSAQGAAISATTVNSQAATIKYGTTSGTYNLTSAPQITNVAESKTIYYQVTAPNHATKTGSYTLTITEKSITIPAPTSNTKTYNGSAYSATFPAATGATITKYQYSTDNSTWTESSSNPSRTNVGTTYVQAYYDAGTNYTGSGWSSSATIKIKKASFTVSEPDQTYTYNGSAQGVAITVSNIKGSQTATIKYGTTSETYNLTAAPTQTTANPSSPKTVYWQVTVPNHATQTGSYTITVSKATPTFALNGETQTFHTTANIKGRASVVGTIYWGTSTSSMTSTTSVSTASTTTFNTTVTSRGESAGVGTTTIYAYFVPTDTTNYNSVGSASDYAESAAAKLEASDDNDISVTISNTLYYTGSGQVIATKTSGEGCAHFTLGYSTTSGGTVTWGTQDATTISVTNPGTYYIHYKVTPDSNHSTTITDKQLDGTSTIGNGTLTISVTGYSGTYDGSAHNIVASGPSVKNQANQSVTSVTYTYSTSENGTYGSMPTITNATGTSSNENATATYWVKASKSGYNDAKKSFTVKVTRANNPLTISPTTATIYNTSGYNTVTITPSGAQGTVSYSSNATGKATVSNAGVVTYVAAGSATITVSAAGNANYKAGSATCAVTTVVDTVSTYGNVTGTITITQKKQFPAGGVSLTTSNITTYFEYTSTCTQTKTWVSGNTTSGTISYAWGGTSISIPSLGTSETSTTTSREISFNVTATGEGNKSKTQNVTSGNQEANTVTSVSLALKSGSTTTTSVAYGSTVSPELTATLKSGSSKVVTPTSVTSSDTTVAIVI